MEIIKALSSSEFCLLIIIAVLLIINFVIKSKNRNNKPIEIKNNSQIKMFEKYNIIIDEYNEFIENCSDINALIDSDRIRFKTEDDCALFEKKVKDFNFYESRINVLMEELPDLIKKTKKKAFDTHCKDINIYKNRMKVIIIEINTILEKDTFSQNEINEILSKLNGIFNEGE